MRIIKVNGRSVVIEEQNNPRRLRRKLVPNGKARGKEEDQSVDIGEFLQHNEKYFLSQWGSIFDKLLSKNDKPYRSVYNARDAAGNAFFKYWIDNKLLDNFDQANIENKWREFVHPYKEDNIQDDPEEDDKKPAVIKSLFTTLTGIKSIKKVSDWNAVADAVYKHLYQNEKKAGGKGEFKKGLIERRARAISHNVRQYVADDTDTSDAIFSACSQTDQRHITAIKNGIFNAHQEPPKEYQLEQLIYCLQVLELEATQKNNKHKNPYKLHKDCVAYPYHHDITACFKEHAKKVFKNEGNIRQAKQNYPELWAYHSSIEAALKKRYPKVVHPDRKRRGLYPVTATKLHNLAVHLAQNGAINFAIRLGKIIHYQAGEQNTTGLALATGDGITNHAQAIAQSRYWLSAGQTEIKQKEAFVRHWLTAIAIGNITLSRLLDPLGEMSEIIIQAEVEKRPIGQDYITKAPFLLAIQHLSENPAAIDAGKEQLDLLFGGLTDQIKTDNDYIVLVTLLRVILAKLRNNSFHYKKAEVFFRALDEMGNNLKQSILGALTPKNTSQEDIKNRYQPSIDKWLAQIGQYMQAHKEKQQKLRLMALHSVDIHYFLNVEQSNEIFRRVIKDKQDSLPIPRFNRLVQRAQDIHRRDNSTTLLPIDDDSKKGTDGYRCGYTLLKKLYEMDFTDWLTDQTVETLQKFANFAIKRAEKITTKLQKGKATTKMSRLHIIDSGDIKEYFNYIAQESAQEASLQQSKNRYQPSKQGGREHSNFVDNFKMDFLIKAFHQYLASLPDQLGNKLKTIAHKGNKPEFENYDFKKIKEDYLKKLQEEAEQKQNQTEDKNPRPWIYLVLHLMPIEFINHLSLQIKKQHTLTDDKQFIKIEQAINLYLDMHDAALDLSAINKDTHLKSFYADNAQQHFNDYFKQTDTHNSLIPVRGLREIQRFGNSEMLANWFECFKVTQDDLCKFEALSNNIAAYQEKKNNLHKQLVKKEKISVKNRLKMIMDAKKKGCQIIDENNKFNMIYKQVVDNNEFKKFSKIELKIIYQNLTPYYKLLNQQIITYRELKNKIYLHNPKQAHQLVMAFIGRMISFVQHYERDIYFVMLALFFLQEKEASVSDNKGFRSSVKNGEVITAISKKTPQSQETEEQMDAVNDIAGQLDNIFKITANKATRNNLAHINYLRPGTTEPFSFTRIVNRMRTMMGYDRKLKNAQSKAVIELFERHDFILRFNIQDHQLVYKEGELQAKTIYHLGGKKSGISETLHSEGFVKVIEKLFKPV